VLADARTGVPVAQAFDALSARTGLPIVARFSAGLAVALERGTPLADVLHAQAADVREAGRRDLIEIAARKEVLMMIPVVFLVLPITVLFALSPQRAQLERKRISRLSRESPTSGAGVRPQRGRSVDRTGLDQWTFIPQFETSVGPRSLTFTEC
jgi:pilus assembly protein TadC